MADQQNASSCYTFTLGLGGASCTGKTTIASKLKERYKHTILVHQDDFYKDDEECTCTDLGPLWDAPEALEVGRLKSYLREVQKQPTVFCEACRKDSHERDSDCTHGHLVVLEGTMVLNLSGLESMMDVRMHIDTTLELCASRRRLRCDYATKEAPGYLEKYAWPMFEKGRKELVEEKQAGNADTRLVFLDGTSNVPLSDLEAMIWRDVWQRMLQMSTETP